MELQEKQNRAALLFRLLFTTPGEEGELTTSDTPFLRQLKGLIDAFTGRGGEAVCADYFNEIYRRWGKEVRSELFSALFESYTDAGVIPGQLDLAKSNDSFLVSETIAFFEILQTIRETLPAFGVLPGAGPL